MRNFFTRLANTSMSELRGILLVICGTIVLGYYYSWWFYNDRLASPLLILAFIVAVSYGIFQIMGSWVLYLATHHRKQDTNQINDNLTVEVFITACGEEQSMVERALGAACCMRGSHKTWLLDDKNDASLARLAKFYGAGYITRKNKNDAKAGNVNHALTQTVGDIIVIFDIDHLPKPEFLERTIHNFADPKVGFVQVMPTFSNGQESWVARAAAETSLDFYNPTSIGMDGLKSVTKMGTNSLIRREALESIGGYQPGLAEDLATSLELHAAEWSSVYVAEPLAPGLVPPDLAAWFTQQLKWSRGVFELLLTAYPRLFSRLSWGQRLAYAVRTTKYWIGFIIFLHVTITITVMFSESSLVKVGYEEYLIRFFPLAFAEALIRSLALRKWSESARKSPQQKSINQSLRNKSQGKAVALVYATWPIYTIAWFMAVFRLPLNFKPTPKNTTGLKFSWILPQIITTAMIGSAVLFSLSISGLWAYPLALLFAILQMSFHIVFLWRSISSVVVPSTKPKLLQYTSDVHK